MSEPQASVFKYVRPEMRTRKTFVKLARTDRMMAYVQVLSSGGENNLHSHGHLDGFWMVLKGRARFYGEGDKLLADLGPHEGILLPRNFRYWFESASPEPLELLGLTGGHGHREALAQQGIASSIFYPMPLHRQPAYEAFHRDLALPAAEAAARTVLSLPINPLLDEASVARICARIRETLR